MATAASAVPTRAAEATAWDEEAAEHFRVASCIGIMAKLAFTGVLVAHCVIAAAHVKTVMRKTSRQAARCVRTEAGRGMNGPAARSTEKIKSEGTGCGSRTIAKGGGKKEKKQ